MHEYTYILFADQKDSMATIRNFNYREARKKGPSMFMLQV